MEEASELLKKVRKIEIKTRGLSKQIFAGEYHSAFKGRGMAFSEVRDYNYGDDIRNIDWNVTARFNSPHMKIFEEERELTVMLLVDMSASREFGTKTQLKRNLITELSAVLSFSAIQNNDKIGVIMFTDKIEKFIPPQKGKKHILRIIRELITFKPDNSQTNISEALRYLTNAIKKRCTAFVISDFMDVESSQNNAIMDKVKFDEALRIASNKHDMVAIKVFDEREKSIPKIGLLKVKDAETGESTWVNTSDRIVRENYEKWFNTSNQSVTESFTKSGVDHVVVNTDEDYVKPLIALFKRR